MGGEGWVWKGRLRGMGALRFSGAPVGFGGAVPYLQPPRVVWVGLGIFALMHGMD